MKQTAPQQTRSLREMTRDAVRTQISETVIDLVAKHGFDQVTVEQIAAAVGISTRSFNRYFPTKEDAILGDVRPWGKFLTEAFTSRPAKEPAWASLQGAYLALLDLAEGQGERRKRIMRVIAGTPSLRARNLEKQLLWEQALTPVVAERIEGADALLRAQALVRASLGCFDIALTTWVEPTETRTLAELLTLLFNTLELTR
ncbi:TetR family transcriptional regulator [Arthrobacter sp. UYEF20]|uniref:acyl-CoA-like ligand-binding transcription factor n=1 Tax=Arthrobacter sp. UYEF20 TaxID=1756363 RepID=UPI003396E3F6